MKKYFIMIFISLLINFYGCKKDDNNPSQTVLTAQEQWESFIGNDSTVTSSWTLNKKNIYYSSISGEWKINYNSSVITCTINEGAFGIIGNKLTFVVNGTAINPALPVDSSSSTFFLNVNGEDLDTTSTGKCKGTYTISFKSKSFPTNLSGNWIARLKSGSGITNW